MHSQRVHRLALLILLPLLAAAVAGCIAPVQAPGSAPAPVKLKVAVTPYLSYAPFYLAAAEGYFADQGLDVEIVRVIRASDAIAALAQGELDVAGFPVSSALLNAIVRDSGVKIVASKERLVEQNCVYSGLVLRTGLELGDESALTPELLKSLRYDVTVTSVSGFVLDTFLQAHGAAIEDVTIVDTESAAAALEVMQQGGLDIAAMTEPWITRAEAAGAGKLWLARNAVAPDNQLAVVAYGPTILQTNPAAGERFMVAYLQGVRRFAEGMTEPTLDLLEKELELDRALLTEMCPPYIPADGAVNLQSIVDFGNWAAARDLIDAPVTPDMFWEPRFVDAANQTLKDTP